jgi:hypothetical protein
MKNWFEEFHVAIFDIFTAKYFDIMRPEIKAAYEEWLPKHNVDPSIPDYINTINTIEKYSGVDIDTFIQNTLGKAIEELCQNEFEATTISQMKSRLKKYLTFIHSEAYQSVMQKIEEGEDKN